MATIKALEIDIDGFLKVKRTSKRKTAKIYFLNMWDMGAIKDLHFYNNYYLTSLFSIAKDLDHSEFSALKDFKHIRNKLEHGSIKIFQGYRQPKRQTGKDQFYKKDLVEKTLLLLMLTKSAIFTFLNVKV